MTEPSNHVVRKIAASDGFITTIAGVYGTPGWTPDGPAASSVLSMPWALLLTGGDSTLVWTEQGSCIVRQLSLGSSVVTTVAGSPRGCGYVEGPALSARFAASGLLGLAAYGNDLFIADTCRCRCRLAKGLGLWLSARIMHHTTLSPACVHALAYAENGSCCTAAGAVPLLKPLALIGTPDCRQPRHPQAGFCLGPSLTVCWDRRNLLAPGRCLPVSHLQLPGRPGCGPQRPGLRV